MLKKLPVAVLAAIVCCALCGPPLSRAATIIKPVAPDSSVVVALPDTVWLSANSTCYHKHFHVPTGEWVLRKDAEDLGLTYCKFCFRPTLRKNAKGVDRLALLKAKREGK